MNLPRIERVHMIRAALLTASKHCGSGLKNYFVVVVVAVAVVLVVVVVADELLSFKNELIYL